MFARGNSFGVGSGSAPIGTPAVFQVHEPDQQVGPTSPGVPLWCLFTVSEEEYSVSLRHWISNPHCSTARRVASAARSCRAKTFSIPSSSIRSRATLRPSRRLVEGGYGKNPVAFTKSISPHPRNLRVSFAFSAPPTPLPQSHLRPPLH